MLRACTTAVDPCSQVAMRVIEGVYDGVTTTELDNLAAEVAATNAVTHPDYASLASRIAVSNLHKATKKSFAETMEQLHTYLDPITGAVASLVATDVIEIIRENAEYLRLSDHLRSRFQLRLLRIQDARAQLPLEDQR